MTGVLDPVSACSALVSAPRLVHLSTVDLVIIVFYFVLVLAIGFYLKKLRQHRRRFLHGRPGNDRLDRRAELSLRQPRLARNDGLGGAAYQYGILAAHWYWIGAIPAMLFLAHRDDAVLLHLQNALGSRLSEAALRRSRRARCRRFRFAFMTVLMSGINMYSMALVMKVVLGWDINFSIWVSSLTVAIYVMRSAGCAPPFSTKCCSFS